jgi:hypothetical protein
MSAVREGAVFDCETNRQRKKKLSLSDWMEMDVKQWQTINFVNKIVDKIRRALFAPKSVT